LLKYFILFFILFLPLSASTRNTHDYHKKTYHKSKHSYSKKYHHKKKYYRHTLKYTRKSPFLNTKAKYKLGLELGLVGFKSKIIQVDTLNQSTSIYDKKSQGLNAALVFEYYDFSYRLGMIKFLSEPISSAKDLNFDEAYWSPDSKGYYYTQLGYAYDFDKKHYTKLHKYLFVDLGVGFFDYDNLAFKDFATSSYQDYEKNCKDYICKKSGSDILPSFYGDFGAKLTYFYKSLAFSAKIKVNFLNTKAYEGVYKKSDSSTLKSFSYEVKAEPSASFGIAYIF